MKRLKAWVIIVAMLFTAAVPVFAADTATAATMRLVSTEGTVTLTNQNGKTLSIREDMKLYSGYTVKTSAASYAYISLDEKKAIKLDASTAVEIRKSGKKLEVLVSSGKLFFNVTAPLDADEKLEVRTSTIVTGVRGTSGVVNYIDENSSSLSLLDGKVTMQAVDPKTGESVSVPVEAGQMALVTREANTTGTQAPVLPTVTLGQVQAKDVPGFAATEIAKDPVLQQKITEQSKIDVKTVVEKAIETLDQDQKAAEEIQKQAEQAIENLPFTDQKTDPVFGDNPANTKPSGGGGGGSGGGGGGTAPPQEPTTVTLSGSAITIEQIHGALSEYQKVILKLSSMLTVSAEDALAVPAGKELVVKPADQTIRLKVASGGSITVSGTMTVEKGCLVENEGTFKLTQSGSGTLVLKEAEFQNSKTFVMEANSTVKVGTAAEHAGKFVNGWNGANSTGGTVSMASGSRWENYGESFLSADGPTALPQADGTIDVRSGRLIAKGIVPATVNANAQVELSKTQTVRVWVAALDSSSAIQDLYTNAILGTGTTVSAVVKLQNDTAATGAFCTSNLRNLTLELNGKTLTMESDLENFSGCTMKIQSSSDSGRLNMAAYQLKNRGTLDIESGGVTGQNPDAVVVNDGAALDLNVNGGTVETTGSTSEASLAIKGRFTWNGGTVRAKPGKPCTEAVASENNGIIELADGWNVLS